MKILREAKPLASYSSHCGLVSKMWILPDGRAVSFGCQHYEWALQNAARLMSDCGVDLSAVRPATDDAVRLFMLKHGAIRVNYEHRGGRLLLEGDYARWGPPQRRALKCIAAANARDICFVCVRLLNAEGAILSESEVNLLRVPNGKKSQMLQFEFITA